MKTILIVGLGNPGKEHEKTRHNAGFMFADYFFEKFRDDFGFSGWKLDKKLKSEISVGKCCGKKIILLKPQTFMNLSGVAVAAAVKYYKAKLEDLDVVHDDIDLALGKYKISVDSSSAGHNGAQNIIDLLGTKNFTRLRIGVENRGDKNIATEKYVLGKFTIAEMKVISKILPSISNDLAKII
ncbi:MAG: aminoacyl-tRNA hydrolase [Candidatus Moranbacteria bacterium]|nr:aminoacyl-tRNA hydrolase [Candidatus Moranbacteria bacterium]